MSKASKSNVKSNDDEIISSPSMTIFELTRVLREAADAISRVEEPKIFGVELQDTDPILEAARLIKERKLPFVIRRELIPGDQSTTETIDINALHFNETRLDEIVAFVKANTISANSLSVEDLAEVVEGELSAQQSLFAEELNDVPLDE